MNYYYRYPGDYSRDTQDLSLAEHGAYALLLDALYATEKPLPKNPVGLYRVARAFTQEEQQAVSNVICRFFVETEDGYVNTRACSEIDSAKARIDAARENGKKGGRKQKKTQTEPSQEPGGNPVGSGSVQSGKPSGPALQPPTILPTTGVVGKAPRKRSAPPSVEKPEGVTDQTWADWLALRAKKSAPVTPTVIAGARREAAEAGISLDAFLGIWCMRGSQGLHASWLKPAELQQARQRPGTEQPNKQQALEDRNLAVARAWVPPEMRGQQPQEAN